MSRKDGSGSLASQSNDSTSIGNDKVQFKVEKTATVVLVPDGTENISSEKNRPYPEGVFEINKSKVIYAESGTSWIAIAKKYDVSLHHLFDFNDIREQETILTDQLVFLSRKRKKGSVEFHTVKTGETLYSIAQSEGIRLESLLEYNHLTIDKPVLKGIILYLQEKAPQKENISGDKNNRSKSGSL
jgi:LysM repeat protein